MTPPITDYSARDVSREAYLSWLARAIEARRHAPLPPLGLPAPKTKELTGRVNASRAILATI